jgi:hypothetical protein
VVAPPCGAVATSVATRAGRGGVAPPCGAVATRAGGNVEGVSLSLWAPCCAWEEEQGLASPCVLGACQFTCRNCVSLHCSLLYDRAISYSVLTQVPVAPCKQYNQIVDLRYILYIQCSEILAHMLKY